MKPLEAMNTLGIARTTLAAYVRFGKIRIKKIKDNRYDYYDEDVQVLKEMQEYSMRRISQTLSLRIHKKNVMKLKRFVMIAN